MQKNDGRCAIGVFLFGSMQVFVCALGIAGATFLTVFRLMHCRSLLVLL